MDTISLNFEKKNKTKITQNIIEIAIAIAINIL